ncbi:heavy metal translocating P-type ATPase [Hoylesella nanceiensis]|uniref:heavy metal translocating P-type ATPase n=2 Tax=Hoylesella nanceiensis TaxID=425941 RepID=UPI001CAF9C7E|nr:heavy metal translocating P-type ATPase [Hoylesella nanceiensis]MBF1421845.1 heavy metal translocating P-type ATPase [Hoylesella nanceiensis]
MDKKQIPVIGMSCSSCSAHVEKKLQSLKGIKTASVSLPMRSASVEYDPEIITPEDMRKEIQALGYDLILDEEKSVTEIENRAYKSLVNKTIASWVLSILSMAVSMSWISIGDKSATLQVLFIISLINILYCGRQFYIVAIKQLLHRSANMDTLIALSTFIAFAFSALVTFGASTNTFLSNLNGHVYYDASVMIITFALTGRVLEERAKKSTSTAIRSLLGLTPKVAHVVDGGKIIDVPLSTLQRGDIIEVRMGEKVPVDGVITELKTPEVFIDESMITGEPIAVPKRIKDKVLAGTMNKKGTLLFKAQQVGEKTMLANIIKMVQEAQNSKAPVQRIVDKIALIFVPIVLCLSLITFLVWYLIGGPDMLSNAILAAVAVLVIACPCAMGLATPTALMVGIGKAAENSILIKDATALENIKNINAIVIDKTGTLTIPNPNVDFTQSSNLSFEERESLKPHAKEAMEQLQSMGIEVHMMTGDNDEAAQYWAKKAGIKHFKSKVLPQDKEILVRSLQEEGKKVAMIGDGINDSQALAAADVSIAMGKGTDIAIDIAQATLMGTDLRKIVSVITLSKKTVATIHQNLFWAFIYNLVCIPLAAGVPLLFGLHFVITPMWASALMALSSCSVVLNSLRLKSVHL